jgi:4,5:9,10-diseco-3-hydroxy-5,9,17-trioxoandrosta-1(10),2-diene-4-oate hydrolase
VRGGGEWPSSFRETIVFLAAEGYSVHALDLPGHGYTEVHDDHFGYDLPAMTSALAS